MKLTYDLILWTNPVNVSKCWLEWYCTPILGVLMHTQVWCCGIWTSYTLFWTSLVWQWVISTLHGQSYRSLHDCKSILVVFCRTTQSKLMLGAKTRFESLCTRTSNFHMTTNKWLALQREVQRVATFGNHALTSGQNGFSGIEIQKIREDRYSCFIVLFVCKVLVAEHKTRRSSTTNMLNTAEVNTSIQNS